MRSWMAVLLVALAAPGLAAAEEVERFAVVAGAGDGGPGRARLKYAASDAEEVARVLRQLGGVDAADLSLLVDPDPAALRGALAEVGRRIAAARAAGRRPELFVYYSGHSDDAGLLLGGSGLPYGELRQDLEAVLAEVRVVILDSCASGAFTRSKGVPRRPALELETEHGVRGHAFLTSSAADEASQESDRLRASFFTHALLAGLRGAADWSGDGVVTLDEAYQYAFRETLARTEATRAGPQHATYDLSLVGSGGVVMTDLRRAGAVLTLPEGLGGKIFVRSAAGHLVVELKKLPGSRLDLAMDPGDYRVRVARDGRLLEAELSLPPDGRVAVEGGRLRAVDLEATVARGESVDGDGEEVPMAEPAPRAGAPAGRNVLSFAMGSVRLPPGHTQTASGETMRIPTDVGLLLEMGYQRWITDRVSIGGSFMVRSLHFLTNPDTKELDFLHYGLVGFTVGAKYSHPIFAGRGIFLGLGGDVGVYRGVIDEVSSTSGGGTASSQRLVWVPGARLRLSLDAFVSRRVAVGFGVGYSKIAPFPSAIKARRDHSGVEAALTLGYCWGR